MGDLRPATDTELVSAAREVLKANDTGRWTRPSPTQYPHQWNWDSAFISLGWATFDWDRACVEIESMLRARWREGMIPHIHYDPRYVEQYFPGPDRWPNSRQHVAVEGELTSGISNPAVLITAARLIGERQPNAELRLAFWRRVFAPLAGWLGYMATHRQLDGSPLVAMVHPWESGWDNSPRWDHLAAAHLTPRRPYQRLDTTHVAAVHRPTNRDYDAYVALAEMLGDADYDIIRYRERSPFCVYDVALDALWYRAATDLNHIAAQLGAPPVVEGDALAAFATAFEETHWDEDLGFYLDWDCVGNRRIGRPTAAGLITLTGGFLRPERAQSIWRRYRSLQGGGPMVKTVPAKDLSFDPDNYWRGPVWTNVNWLVLDGLRRSGLSKEADQLRVDTLDLVRQAGFAEYFHAEDGTAAGTSPFSWTAALTLILLEEERN
jgi:Trehalase